MDLKNNRERKVLGKKGEKIPLPTLHFYVSEAKTDERLSDIKSRNDTQMSTMEIPPPTSQLQFPFLHMDMEDRVEAVLGLHIVFKLKFGFS